MKNKQSEVSLPSHDLSDEEKVAADKALKVRRFKRLNEMGEASRIYAELLRLKYEIAAYLELGIFDPNYSFGNYLKKYLQIFGLKRRKLAEDISIHETKLSRIVNDKENPGLAIMYRLEEHSNSVIKASIWWNLVTRKVENDIKSNTRERKAQSLKVKNKFRYEGGSL